MDQIDRLYQHVLPRLEQLEAERQNAQHQIKRYRHLAFAAGAILFIAASYFLGTFWGLLVAGTLGLGGFALLYHRATKSYKANYKATVFRELIAGLGPDFHYEAEGSIDENTLRKSGLLPFFNQMKGEDLITCDRPGEAFQLVEVALHHGREGSSSSTPSTAFKGLFMEGSLSTSAPANLYIYSRSAQRIHPAERLPPNCAKVEVDYQAFHQAYQVYSDTPDAAAAFLRPEFLDTILSVRERLVLQEHARLEVSVREDRIYVALATAEEFFEPSLTAPMTDYQLFASNFQFLVDLTGMLRELRDQLQPAE